MSDDRDRFIIRGEVHVSLWAVARCYEVEETWVEEAYQLGLLGAGERVAGVVVISATRLDRVARIVRLHFPPGVSVPGDLVVLLRGDREVGGTGGRPRVATTRAAAADDAVVT